MIIRYVPGHFSTHFESFPSVLTIPWVSEDVSEEVLTGSFRRLTILPGSAHKLMNNFTFCYKRTEYGFLGMIKDNTLLRSFGRKFESRFDHLVSAGYLRIPPHAYFLVTLKKTIKIFPFVLKKSLKNSDYFPFFF